MQNSSSTCQQNKSLRKTKHHRIAISVYTINVSVKINVLLRMITTDNNNKEDPLIQEDTTYSICGHGRFIEQV